jgi:hypothetical protein
MTFLSLNGTTIPCLSPGADEDAEEYAADRDRMFDGTMRLIRRGLFRKWTVTTRLLLPADARTILALINQGGNLTATGDLVDSTDGVYVMPVPGKNTPVMTASGLKRRLTFVLEENPTPFAQDRSAVVHLFLRRGTGYLKGAWTYDNINPVDYTACTSASDGDLVSVWQDQSGNDYHMVTAFVGNPAFFDDKYAPTLDGNALRFGNGVISGRTHGFSGISSTFMGRVDDGGNWWTSLAKGEIMAGLRASNGAPGSAGRNSPWDLNREGGSTDGNFEWPHPGGHVLDPTCANTQYDYGDLTAAGIVFDSLNVYDLMVDLAAVSPNRVFRVNNVQQFSTTAIFDPFFDHASALFGYGGEGAGTSFFDGWFRDIVLFDAPLTTSQRLSWYRYLIGLDTSPPI